MCMSLCEYSYHQIADLIYSQLLTMTGNVSESGNVAGDIWNGALVVRL